MKLTYGWHTLFSGRKGSWTFEVLSALRETPVADMHISAIMSLFFCCTYLLSWASYMLRICTM